MISRHVTAVLQAGTGLQTIFSGSGVIQRITVTKALTGTLTLVGFKDTQSTPAAINLVIPIGFVGMIEFDDTQLDGGLTAQKSSASDDGLIYITYYKAPTN